MEHLFLPCTRLFDLLENQRYLEENDWDDWDHFEIEKELNLDVSTQELLRIETGFTYADLYAMIRNEDTVAWLTPHAYVVRAGGRALKCGNCLVDSDCQYRFTADGKDIVAVARSSEALSEICDVVVRLLAASVVRSVSISRLTNEYVFISSASLAYLMEQCQSLEALTLARLNSDEDHCRVLGGYSRPGLEIVLIRCDFTSAGTSALAEVLGRNQGPTKLVFCEIGNSVDLADGLRGNSHLKRLKQHLFNNCDLVGNQKLFQIAGALKENKGLVVLDLMHVFTISDETWNAVFDSLKTHPTLETLCLRRIRTAGRAPLASAVIKSRIQAVVDMLKENMLIHTVRLDQCLTSTNVYRESIVPYLETNRLRPHVHAIQKTRPIAYRAKVLGRALLAVRTDPNHFWMLLSENSEVVFA
jgi:hypothetical protein